MRAKKPPFRADHVGSLLRPAALRDARARHAAGELSAQGLAEVEDREIERIIAKQQSVGMQSITDGEFRRAMWHKDFLQHLDGIEEFDNDQGLPFKGIVATPLGLRICGHIDFSTHPHLDHFAFVRDHTTATAKMTIPSPSMMMPLQPTDFQDPDHLVYDRIEAVREDFSSAYRKAIRAFHDAGCRYLQIDEVRMIAVTDPGFRARRGMSEHDIARLTALFSQMIEDALRDRPADMVITMHNCRGNFRSHWAAEGGYEPVAEQMFNIRGIDGYFLEYDTDRAGGFEPLRHLPASKVAVLGLITSKTAELESKSVIKRRIDEAAKYVDLDRLGLSPQCGFASTELGNEVTEDQQWAKLDLVRETAEEVWGSV
jgi:5-methyltetrahydropteroyltriglutamate--homocysteine methyltransferase